jgi:hypothetical protein
MVAGASSGQRIFCFGGREVVILDRMQGFKVKASFFELAFKMFFCRANLRKATCCLVR